MKRVLSTGVLAVALVFGLSTAAGALKGLTLTPTAATYVIPAIPGQYVMNLWHTGTLEDSVSGTSGTLTIAVPAVRGCTFQVDVKRDGSYIGGTHGTLPTCGPETTTTTTTTSTTTTTTVAGVTVPTTVPVPPSVPPSPAPVTGVPAHAAVPSVPATLAFTGTPADTRSLIILGVLMVLAGTGLLVVRRRLWS